jgi:hypothetical protein
LSSPARTIPMLAAAVAVLLPASTALSAEPEVRPLADVTGNALLGVAAVNQLPVDQLRKMARGGHFQVDREGRIRSVEHRAPLSASASVKAVPPGVDVFTLHSRAGSNRTIYLDFTGHTVQGTAWNGGARIDAPAFDGDGDPATFNAAEREDIYQAFLGIAEDYRPFDVDVTTQEPPADRITRSGNSDQIYGTRVVITPKDVTNCGCGGQAYIGVFDEASQHSNYQPAWAYASPDYDGKTIAEIVSHETGHNLGLAHDGQSGAVEYYAGHTNWAPIMGVGYSQPVTQWSKGEYNNPSNTQDDLTVIPANGANLVADDHPDTPDSATPLTGNVPLTGIVGSDADVDVFAIEHGGGTLTATALPASYAPNLDIKLVIRNSAATVVATVDPAVRRVSAVVATGLDARFSQSLPAGRYTFQIEGTGYGDPGVNGYTGYGSLGEYTLTVNAT